MGEIGPRPAGFRPKYCSCAPGCRRGAGEHLGADVPQCWLSAQAYDNDQPDTNNSRLHFSLLPGPYSHNFSVDPDNGILRNLGPLDREAIEPALGGRIVLTVLVADYGVPVLSTEVNITINVEVRPGTAAGGAPGQALWWGARGRWPAPPALQSELHSRPMQSGGQESSGTRLLGLEFWLSCVALGNHSSSLCLQVPRL